MYKQKKNNRNNSCKGGSKRLPRKNILNLNGKPLIVWSIDAGLKSKYIDKVIVTSDDAEKLNISNNAGATVINRPAQFASDTATTFDAIKHTITNMGRYDYVILLQPTSPLRSEKHIDEAIEFLFLKQANAVVSVCEMDHNPLWSNTLPEDGNMNTFLGDEVKRSQDLEMYYRINGAIYICSTDLLLSNKSFFLRDNIYAYKMRRMDSIDIDERFDFMVAESIIQARD